MAGDVYIELVPFVTGSFPATLNVTSPDILAAGLTPKAVIVYGHRQVNGNTSEDPNSGITMGWATPGTQESIAGYVEGTTGGGQTSNIIRQRTDRIATSPNESFGVDVFVTAFITGGVTLSWGTTSTPGRQLYMLIIAGADVTAQAGISAPSGTNPLTTSITSLSFQPDAILFNTASNSTAPGGTSLFSDGPQIGMATSSKNRVLGVANATSFFTSGLPYVQACFNDCVAYKSALTANTISWKCAANNFNSTGFDLVTTGSTNAAGEQIMWLALKFQGAGVDIADWVTPSAGVTQVVSGLSFRPGAAIMLASGLSSFTSAYNTDAACVAGFGAAAVADNGSHSWRMNRNVNPTDAKSVTLAHALLLGSKSNLLSGNNVADLDSWASDGMVLDYTAANQTGTQNFGLFVQNKAGVIPSDVRMPYIQGEVIQGDNPNVRIPYIFGETIQGDVPNVRAPYIFGESLQGDYNTVRCPWIFAEIFQAMPVEGPVATDILPISSPILAPLRSQGANAPLKGLTWNIHKKPMFRTTVESAVTGKEVRTSRMEYPIYQFECGFEFLDDRDGGDELERLMGFFMTQRGSWGAWLFQDATDYMKVGQQLGIGDGGETNFPVVRTLGGFTDPVGQIDTTNLFTFASTAVNTGTDAITVPGHGLDNGYGPVTLANPGALPTGLSAATDYWLIVVDDNTLKIASSRANALAGTAINITTQGSGTNTCANTIAVYDNGTLVSKADYTIAMPNDIIFDSAPVNTHVITADFKFFFVCRFMEDIQDFNEFMENLWELESMTFQSIIQ